MVPTRSASGEKSVTEKHLCCYLTLPEETLERWLFNLNSFLAFLPKPTPPTGLEGTTRPAPNYRMKLLRFSWITCPWRCIELHGFTMEQEVACNLIPHRYIFPSQLTVGVNSVWIQYRCKPACWMVMDVSWVTESPGTPAVEAGVKDRVSVCPE